MNVIDGFLEIAGSRIAEIKGWDISDSGSDQDTSIIGLDGKRTRPGAPTRTINLQGFLETTDATQSQLRQGATGSEMTLFPGGNTAGLQQWELVDWSCGTFTATGTNIDGLVEFTAAISYVSRNETVIA